MWTLSASDTAECPQADDALHWPGSNSEHELNGFRTHLLFIAVLHLCIQKVQCHWFREVHKLRGRKKCLLSSSVGFEVYQQHHHLNYG